MRRGIAIGRTLACLAAAWAIAAAPADEEWRRIVVNGQGVFAVPPPVAKAAGLPWEDLPDADNAALPYLRACELPLDAPPEFQQAVEGPWGADWTAFHAWFRGTAALRADARDGAARPRCQFPWLIGTPGAVTLGRLEAPHLPAMRRLALLMTVEANLAAKEGRHGDATDACLTALGMARHVGSQPTLIAAMSSMSMGDSAIAALRRLLASENLPENVLASLAARLADAERGVPDFLRAFRAEQSVAARTLGPEAFLGMAEEADNVRLGPVSEAFLRSRAFAILFPDRTLRRDAEQAAEALMTPLEGPTTWESAAAARRTLRGAPAPGKDWNFLLTGVPQSAWRVNAGLAVLLCDLRALRIEIALRRYRAARGVWPDSLAALTPAFLPALPPDPFSGASYVYHRADATCAFYSVGPDLKDNGGREGRRPQLYENGDILYRCEVRK